MPAVIEVENLRKEYRTLRGKQTLAVAGLDLRVPEGGVFGFLGPNGAGKTTTIRCLLGLVRPSAGRCRVFGQDVDGSLNRVIGRIGSIVEAPALFPGFSGRRNLELLATAGHVDRARIDEVLEQVDLTDRARDRVKKYSLGMRQRLAIAAALLKDPDLLVLDEPANGLDPAGIKEVRELIRRLGSSGRTVFVSSHILSEVRQTCDRVAILARGRCVAEGPVEDVLTGGRSTGLLVRVNDPEAGRAALAAAGMEVTLTDGRLRVVLPATGAASVTRTLAHKGIYLSELRAEEVDLETVFLELTQEEPQ